MLRSLGPVGHAWPMASSVKASAKEVADNTPSKYLRDALFIVRAGGDIIKADFMHIKRTTFPTKMKTGILLEELK